MHKFKLSRTARFGLNLATGGLAGRAIDAAEKAYELQDKYIKDEHKQLVLSKIKKHINKKDLIHKLSNYKQ